MASPWPAIISTFYCIMLWVRYKLPWKTKGRLRDEVKSLTEQHDHVLKGMTYVQSYLAKEVEEGNQLRLDLNAAREEAKGERAARTTLEGQRIQEQEALRRLTFGLSNGLEATLGLVNEFIAQSPDFTPDQADREQVMTGLVKQVH